MTKFIEIPASKTSIKNRRLVFGVGLNDANYNTHIVIDGLRVRCPYYSRWSTMIGRCYSDKIQDKHPTYKGCSVCKEWLIFSNFKEWMSSQQWEGKEIDKDLIIKGNKIYSPETCMFVSSFINTILGSNAAKRGKHPQGVSFKKEKGLYIAVCKNNKKQVHIGYFSSPVAAEKAYLIYKASIVKNASSSKEANQDKRIKNALIREYLHLEEKAEKL